MRSGRSAARGVAEAERLFHEAMDDDFNSAKALGHLFDLARDVNRAFDEGADREARSAAQTLKRLGGVLGLFWEASGPRGLGPQIMALVVSREEARKARDWNRADEIRAELLSQGVLVEDGASGPRLKRRS